MTPEQILDGNVVIAEFMGWKKHKGHFVNPDNGSQVYKVTDFNYLGSWDNIMPVWIRVLNMENKKTLSLDVRIGKKSVFLSAGLWTGVWDSQPFYYSYDKDEPGRCSTLIECYWMVIVQFLVWYNKTKK